MVFIEVFSKNIQITYKSSLLSKATLLVFIFGVISVVLPFIFAYKSKGFWLKRDVFYEQADIKFKGEYIFVATTNNLSKVIACSTLPYYQQNLEFLDACSNFKVREIDKNFDGKVDELYVNLQVNLPEETHLTSIAIIIPLDYRLHNICPLQMQAAIIFQEFLPLTIASYMVVGDVTITQLSPLFCHRKQINNVHNYSIIKDENNIDDYAIFNIITNYSTRNISTVLTNIYTNFIPGNPEKFDLNLKVRYPEHKLYYKPGFWQIIKWAWIQYLAIYVIITWVVTRIKSYIFNRRLVLFYEDNPVKKKQ